MPQHLSSEHAWKLSIIRSRHRCLVHRGLMPAPIQPPGAVLLEAEGQQWYTSVTTPGVIEHLMQGGALYYHSRVCRQGNWRGHVREDRAVETTMPDLAVYAPPQEIPSPQSLPSGADTATPDLDMSAHRSCTLDEYDEQHLAYLAERHQAGTRSSGSISDLTTQVMSLLMRNLSGQLRCSQPEPRCLSAPLMLSKYIYMLDEAPCLMLAQARVLRKS